MDEIKYDDIFFSILKEEGQIVPFLNTVFGFLYRRTDFYCIQEHPKGKLGFPAGIAEKIVQNIFRKWEQISQPPQLSPNNESDELPDMSHLVIQEVEVETTPADDASQPTLKPPVSKQKTEDPSSDIYNGADCGSYRWSQSITDVDIQIPIASTVTKACDVKVQVESHKLEVHAQIDSEWQCLVEGELVFRNKKEDSVWSLLPGKHISIHLEKSEERWWQALFTTEPKLDMKKIETSRPITDLGEEEQMKIAELMWKEDRKQQGLLAPQPAAMASILQKSWNVQNSPFKNIPYDPNIVTQGTKL